MAKLVVKQDPTTGAWPDFTVENGSKNQIILSSDLRTLITVVEYEDTLFRLESAVVLPEREVPGAEAGDSRKISTLGVAAEVLRFLHAKNQGASDDKLHSILVAGHTDTSGTDSYNLQLSQNRAKTVLSLLTGDAQQFAAICHQLNRWMRVADYQQILTWLSESRGWDCHPGPTDDEHTYKTQTAVNNFRKIYNESGPGARWAPAIKPTTGDPNNQQTWEGYFHCYQEYLAQELGTDVAGLATFRSSLRFAYSCRWVGCGEHHPRSWPGVDNLREQDNRRVEVMLFEPRDTHEPLACCPTASACNKSECVLYKGEKYARVLRTPGCRANRSVVAQLPDSTRISWKLTDHDFLFKVSDNANDAYFNATCDFWLKQSGLRIVAGVDSLELLLLYLENRSNFVGIDSPRIHVLMSGSDNRAWLRLRMNEAVRILELPYTSGKTDAMIDRGDFGWFFARKWPTGLSEGSKIYMHGCSFGGNPCLTHTFWQLLGSLASLETPRTELSYSTVDGSGGDDTAAESRLYATVDYSFFKTA